LGSDSFEHELSLQLPIGGLGLPPTGLATTQILPKFSILNPAYAFTLPKVQVANGIVDAFVHTAEQYITYPVDARVQDRMAEGILQTLIKIGTTTGNEPGNYSARANHVRSATMALNGIIAVGVPQDWTTRMLGNELTPLFVIEQLKVDGLTALSQIQDLSPDICQKMHEASR
jgi:alcohol dehydrogenase YqhD (iron-dependent ADH family)